VTATFAALGLLLVVLGWPMATGRVRPNRWYGFRVPATFADEGVWYEANARAGRDTMALGVLVLVLALVLPLVVHLPSELHVVICAGVLGIGAMILTVRGWHFANRLLRERRGDR